jgi:hypothetical protein
MLKGLLLGAGASFEAGFPLTSDLTAEIRAWLTPDKFRSLNERWRLQGGGHPPDVVEDFCRVLINSAMHYESILGHLEVEFMRHRTRRQEYHSLYGWLAEIVYHILYYRQVRNPTYITSAMADYAGIAGLAAANRPLWIFTLNHDLNIECAAVHHGVPLNFGLPGRLSLPLRRPSGEIFSTLDCHHLTGEELARSGFSFPTSAVYGINLLKVHGALDVFACHDGSDIIKIATDATTVADTIDAVRAANEELFYPHPNAPNGRAKVVNEIAYADLSGEMQFLRRTLLAGAFKFDNRHAQALPKRVLDEFRLRLGHLTQLAAIGYGFGDQHINQIVREWLERSRDNRLEIVSPGLRSAPQSLLHLMGQIDLVDATASQYLQRSATTAPTRQEKLLHSLRVQGRQIQRQLKGYA